MGSTDIKAMAKINLALDVTGRRDNGYHDVRMIMQSIGLYDELTIAESVNDDGIRIETDRTDLPVNEDNLIYRAAALIKDECGINTGVRISLKKNIPIAAGMAGGSTDAAAVLKGMNELFSLGLTFDRLCELGVRIGADVPYCIMGGTALSEGIGEILTALPPMPGCSILIAKPAIGVSTGYVYGAFDKLKEKQHPDVDGMIRAIEDKDLKGIAGLLGNSLEGVTVKEYPVIREIKNKMNGLGALGSLMSGSGPTVFGLFDKKDTADSAAEEIKSTYGIKEVFVVKPC
ncbi:MAG: 4-(cytidine 5'-diphospho)-2-C-methyl-D-erythritol kinase [Lachnospiraceae bacterium]|nr:4-(cytidine 5'-diphospho)-2-C-methyl-D-erythritol kinase [Lachnospiraceae bacterium]